MAPPFIEIYNGSTVAIVTPMGLDGEIDIPALRSLVDWHIESGTRAIVAVGTTGESPVLSVEEHLAVIEATIDQVAGRIPVIAGNGSNSTIEAIHLTRAAAALGADACLCVTPYYNKPSQEGMYQHFKQIAAAEKTMPQILYNVPSRTAVDLMPETVNRLSHIDNIIGIKEASGSLLRLRELVALLDDQFMLLSGDDASSQEFMLRGGHGVISVTANIAPEQMSRMCEFALSGDQQKAQQSDEKLTALHRDLFLEANPVPVKWALQQMQRIDGGIRLPLLALDSQYHQQVRKAMEIAGIQV